MAKNPRKENNPTKKHLARLERERRQTQTIMIVSIVVLVLVALVIGYGVLDETVLQSNKPVALVNGEKITVKDFQAQTRYARYTTINNAYSTYQFAQYFGSDANSLASFAQQLQQYESQLSPLVIGEQVVDRMVEDQLIRQEAERLGITVTKEEVEKSFEEAFRYFPDGTPTPTATLEPIPTSTLSAQQLTLIPPTATATITPTLSITDTMSTATQAAAAELTATFTPTSAATSTPTVEPSPTLVPTASATPTAYTFEAYETQRAETVTQYETEYQIKESDLFYVLESNLYRQKLMESLFGDLPRTTDQVWALHILVEDEQTAKDILARLEAGEDWGSLASAYSTDTSNKDQGGDLGWFGKGRMVAEFEEAAFALGIGETSQPVKTSFGYHIIRVLGHEPRPLSDEEYQQLKETEFQNWLTQQRESSDVEIMDTWKEIVPTEPTLPAEIQEFISGALGQVTGEQ